MPGDPNKSEGFSWPVPLAGLRGVKRANIPREIAAGITLAALIIPLNIGYAQVAGLPPVTGLYSAIVPLAIFALFTSSRHVVGSPDASIAGLVGASLLAFAAPGDPMRLQYGLALAVVCAALFFVFWYFRLAFLANFLSRPVLIGFVSGLGIEVFTNQIRKILAAPHDHGSQLLMAAERIKGSMASSVETEGYVLELVALVDSIPRANLYSVAIGITAFVVVRLTKRYAPRVPGALVALVLLTALVAFFKLDAKGVGVLGEVPSGLPSIAAPTIPAADYLRLIPGAFAVVAITLCEGLLLVRSYSQKHGYKADGNQVLFAYGAANLAAGFTGSLVTGNSPSRSAAMEASGSNSQLPSLVAAATVCLVMLFFTDLLAYLPTAALAAIVASAVLSLIEVSELRELYRLRRSEFWIAIACLVSVLVLGPLRAVTVAFLLAVVDVIRRASAPGTWILREAPDGSHFVPLDPGSQPVDSDLVIYRFGSPIYFANANLFSDEIERLVINSPTKIRHFVLDAEAIVDIDTTGAEALHQVLTRLTDHGVTVAMSRVNESVVALLEHYRLLKLIGKDRLYPTNRHAIAAYRQVTASVDHQASLLDVSRGEDE